MGDFRKMQWRMLLITMFCYLFFYTGRHNFGWAAQGMAADMDISYSMIGWISFSMLIGYAIGQLVNGNFADRFSPRIMIPLGALLSVSTNLAISFSDSPTVILVLWAMNGYFQSMAWAPGSRLITNWWGSAERGKAFGFYTMAAGSSSAVTYLLSIYLLQQHMEWRMLFRVPVAFLLIASVIFFLVARSKPSDVGHHDPDGEPEAAPEKKAGWKDRYRVVWSNRAFLVACLAIGFQSMARYGLIFWVPVHYLGGDWKANPSYLWATFLMPVGMALGALSFGFISDTFFNHNKVVSIRFGMAASALVALVIYWLPVHQIAWSGFFMLLAGFFVYGPQANFWPLSPELLGKPNTGTGVGVMNMVAYVFAAVGEPLLGHIIDWSGNTASVFLAVSGICACSAIAVSFVSPRASEQVKSTTGLRMTGTNSK